MVRLIPAKCPTCGANLQLPDHLRVGYCSHCGGKVIIEKDQVEVHHTGAVSSLPLCPSCGNTLTEGNRLIHCELCQKKECFLCSSLSAREAAFFDNAKAYGLIVSNSDLTLCRKCKRERWVTCGSCYRNPNGNYVGTGRCAHCGGRGRVGTFFNNQCPQCAGTGTCPVCRGSGWTKLF